MKESEERVKRCREIGEELIAHQLAVETLSAERISLLRELRHAGYTLRDIGAAVGLSDARVLQLTGAMPAAPRPRLRDAPAAGTERRTGA